MRGRCLRLTVPHNHCVCSAMRLRKLFAPIFMTSISVYFLTNYIQFQKLTKNNGVDVDLVITYVNHKDAKWRREYWRFLSQANGDTLPFAATKNRFQDRGDLRFLLRSVEKY